MVPVPVGKLQTCVAVIGHEARGRYEAFAAENGGPSP